MNDCDVLIVGAGAAGLAAAVEVAAAGKYVCVLEARDRLGGRIFTRHDPQAGAPLELGAEFIHGEAPSIMRWLQRANVPAIDARHERWRLREGELAAGDEVFNQMREALARIGKPRRDLPFAQFLAAHQRELSKPVREFARVLVEGFDAADATRVSTIDTLREWAGQGAADAPSFRPLRGYAALLDALVGALDHTRARVQLNTVVRAIRWRRGSVEIETTQAGRVVTFNAARAIITLPLGVLQSPPQRAGAVHFDPPLTTKQSVFESLAMGAVIKVVMQFHSRFWETLDHGRYRDGTFFHAAGAVFPTMWTQLPLRVPVLNAWSAGPRAVRISRVSNDELIQHALASVEAVFGAKAKVREQWQGASVHNWQSDPFARGAYTYVLAGGSKGRKELARPLANTLYFAGEAADVDGESGTVAGALQSGERVAREVLRRGKREA